MTDIFLGRAGGTTQSIGDVYAVRPTRIRLDHNPEQPSIDVDEHVTVRAR